MADQPEEDEGPRARGTPILEWVAGGIGLALTLAMLGFIGWQAFAASGSAPPDVAVRVERVVTMADGWVAEVVAVNRSTATAAAVEIQGELRQGGAVVATSRATFDFVPGGSERRGGLFFDQDPRGQELDVRALGYTEP